MKKLESFKNYSLLNKKVNTHSIKGGSGNVEKSYQYYYTDLGDRTTYDRRVWDYCYPNE